MTPVDRRRQLLDAALRIIIRDGYGAVSIETIAREVDVSRPVIYGVFNGLGELLGCLLDRQERRALRQLAAAIPGPPGDQDPGEFVVVVVRSMVEVVASDPDTWHPILLPPDGTPKVVRERIDHDRELVRREFEGLLAWALSRRGSAADGVDLERIVTRPPSGDACQEHRAEPSGSSPTGRGGPSRSRPTRTTASSVPTRSPGGSGATPHP